jgi:6-phosphogluconolactonase (cycloisomerase 2 family)
VEFEKDGVGGVDGLGFARSVTVSPDGRHVYSIGQADSAVAVFSRDSTSGELTFVEFEKDGVGGVDGLAAAFSVTVSPDGKHIYVASNADSAVAVFSRNSTTGELTFVEVQKDGVDGVDGLALARSVTVSPDGKHVYAAGWLDNAVAVFSRNSTTGELTFVEFEKQGVGGVDGLGAASSVTVSPDGKHLYVASFGNAAVAVFSRSVPTADLEVTKSGSPNPVTAGTNLTYTILDVPDRLNHGLLILCQ